MILKYRFYLFIIIIIKFVKLTYKGYTLDIDSLQKNRPVPAFFSQRFYEPL